MGCIGICVLISGFSYMIDSTGVRSKNMFASLDADDWWYIRPLDHNLSCICPTRKMYLSKLLNVFVQIAKCICPMLTGERFPQRWRMIYIPPLGHLIIVTWAARRHNGTRVGLTTMQWYKGGEVLGPNLWKQMAGWNLQIFAHWLALMVKLHVLRCPSVCFNLHLGVSILLQALRETIERVGLSEEIIKLAMPSATGCTYLQSFENLKDPAIPIRFASNASSFITLLKTTN